MKFDAITVGEITAVILGLVALIKGTEYLCTKFSEWADAWLSKGLDKGLVPVYEKIDGVNTRIDGLDRRIDETNDRIDDVNTRIDGLDRRIDEIDKRLTSEEVETMRPELMRMLSLADRGNTLSEFEEKHLVSLKKKYNEKGGDSYIDDYYDRLLHEGKIKR